MILWTDEQGAKDFGEGLAERMLLAPLPIFRWRVSTLGGQGRAMLMLLCILDAPDTWRNGIMENARHVRLELAPDGTLRRFDAFWRPPVPFRRCKVKDVNDAGQRLDAYMRRLQWCGD